MLEIEMKEILKVNEALHAVIYQYGLDAPKVIIKYNMLLQKGDELERAIRQYLTN
jgi:hypothetical protein